MVMKIQGYDFPEDLYYDRHHSWARLEGNVVVQGLTELGQALAMDIIFIGLPRVKRDAQQGQTLFSLESGKWVGRIPAMVSGTVMEVNSDLEESAQDIHNFPYESGWILKINMSNPAELETLDRPASKDFETFVAGEIEKYKKVLKK
jgi:glycine cleavage system H protein